VTLSSPAGLCVRGLHKRFRSRHVLRGCDLALERGALAITGDNGAGKSTLLAVVAGLVPPDAGELTLGGLALSSQAARALVGFVPEALVPFAELRAGEFLALVATLRKAPPPSQEGVLHLLEKPMGGLSLGERRRVLLTAALVGSPRLLLLDEPSNGLDEEGRAWVLAVLLRHLAGGGLALLATHDLPFAQALRARRMALEAGLLLERTG
jgi:ABC-type multidrug transport system ATPase subunit